MDPTNIHMAPDDSKNAVEPVDLANRYADKLMTELNIERSSINVATVQLAFYRHGMDMLTLFKNHVEKIK